MRNIVSDIYQMIFPSAAMNSDFKARHVVHVITGLLDGGAEGVLYRLVTADHDNRHTVISLMDGGKYRPMLEKNGIEVHSMGMLRGRPSISALLHLRNLISQLRPDLVQTWMYHADLMGGVAARLAGVRRVVWGLRHTTFEKDQSFRNARMVSALNARLSYRIPSKIIACAHRSKSIHIDRGFASDRITVVPNGYDTSKFHIDPVARQEVRAEFALPEDRICIGMVARFSPQKDHFSLITALGILRQRGERFTVILVGRGLNSANSELLRAIERSGLVNCIHLAGARADVPAIMNALDLHVLSSSSGEAFPNVLCEAMSCGTPCIATDVGDARIIIDDTGKICRPQDPDALCDALVSALPLAHNYAASQAARNRILSNFSLETMVGNYKATWASLM